MTVVSPRLCDPALPAVAILLGPEARRPLEEVYGPLGRLRTRQVTWWPGRSITVRFDVRTTDGSDHAQVVACSGDIPDGAAVVESDGIMVGTWAVPKDPALPGLASALHPHTVERMLGDLGMAVDRVELRLRSYRPARRAVVQVDAGRSRLFLKVGPPRLVSRLHETHRRMAAVLPVPQSLGFDAGIGVLVMPAGRGVTLRRSIDGTGSLPRPDDVTDLLERIPQPTRGDRSSPIERLRGLTDLLAAIAPDEAGRVEELVGRIGPELDGPTVPVHGDFHDGQMLVDDGAISGLLDVDTHAWGHPADDAATLLGHLLSRRPTAPDPNRLDAVSDGWERAWAERVGGRELRRRAVAVMIGLATGPFRVQQEGWPALVRARIATAGDALETDEKALIGVSDGSHGRSAH